MKSTLRIGLKHELVFTIPANKTVPHLYPESARFQEMPDVLATGFMVGLLEWCCLECMIPHLDWPREQTVGTHVNFSHSAATVAGQTVTVVCEVIEVDRRKVVFDVVAHDGLDEISRGTHERFVVDAVKFNQTMVEKRAWLAAQ